MHSPALHLHVFLVQLERTGLHVKDRLILGFKHTNFTREPDQPAEGDNMPWQEVSRLQYTYSESLPAVCFWR
jgi:hypothetical protein